MRKILFILTAAVLLLTAAGCASGGEKLTKITLNEVTHSVFYAPQYAAIYLGYFEDEGLEVELVNGGGADKTMTALISGDADFGLMGAEAAIYVTDGQYDDPPVIIGQLTQRDGSFLMGRSADDSFQWEDLEGKTIIGGREGGVPLMTLEHVLRLHGLIPGDNVEVITNIQFNMMGGAFAGGTGDYVTLFEPTASEFEAQGQGCILASVGEESGEIAYTCYMAKESLTQEDPDLVAAFLRAIARGQAFVENSSAEAVAEAISPAFPDTDINTLVSVVENYRAIDAWRTDPVVSQTAVENLEAIMIEYGTLEKIVDFDSLVDNSFAEAAR